MTSSWKRLVLLSAVCWVALAVVLALAYWVPSAERADGWAVNGFLNLHRSGFHIVAYRIAFLAAPTPWALLSGLLVGIALYRRRFREAIAVVALLGGSAFISQVLKVVLRNERWHTSLGDAHIPAASFPSGHAAAAMTLAFAAVIVAPAAWRHVVAIGGAVFALAVSESILILTWHFPSDVVGGFLVATGCALLTVAALQFAQQRWPEPVGRETARRVISDIDVRRTGLLVVGFVLAALAIVQVAAGARAGHFADHHTTAVVAALAIAVLAAALPLSVTAVGARRS